MRDPPSSSSTLALRRIDRAKFIGQRVTRDLGQSARELDTGRSTADDDERQPRCALGRSVRAFSALERNQDATSDLERIVQRFQSRCMLQPIRSLPKYECVKPVATTR